MNDRRRHDDIWERLDEGALNDLLRKHIDKVIHLVLASFDRGREILIDVSDFPGHLDLIVLRDNVMRSISNLSAVC